MVETNFSVNVIVLVENNSLDWSTVVHLFNEVSRHNICFVSFAEYEILNHMKLIVVSIHANVNLRFAKTVLAGWINQLRNSQVFHRLVGVELNMRFESVNTAALQPLIAELSELEEASHRGIILGVIGLLKGSNEVSELGVAPLVLLEVVVKGVLHVVLSEDFVGLLQERCSLSV